MLKNYYFGIFLKLFIFIFAYNINIICEALDNFNYKGTDNQVIAVDNLYKILPFENSIKEVHGKGNLKISVFTDSSCGYCRKLKNILDGIDNITIYNFLIPFFNFEKSVKIWCNKDRLATWNNFMSYGIAIPNVKSCSNPIKDNMNIFDSLGFYSIPIIIFPNGKYYEGLINRRDLLIKVIKENQ